MNILSPTLVRRVQPAGLQQLVQKQRSERTERFRDLESGLEACFEPREAALKDKYSLIE